MEFKLDKPVSSWTDLVAMDMGRTLRHNANPEINLGILKDLDIQLVKVANAEKYDPYAVIDVPRQSSYELKNNFRLEHNLASNIQILPDYILFTTDKNYYPSLFAGDNNYELIGEADEVSAAVQILPNGELLCIRERNAVLVRLKPSNRSWEFAEVVSAEKTTAFHSLPNRVLIDAGANINVKTKNPHGIWVVERIPTSLQPVTFVQGLPDGRVVSAGIFNNEPAIFVSERETKDLWKTSQVIVNTGTKAVTTRAFNDGTIVSMLDREALQICRCDQAGNWQSRVFEAEHSPITSFQLVKDGRIILLTSNAGGSRISQIESAKETWNVKCLLATRGRISSFQVQSDGKIYTSGGRSLKIWEGVPE